MDFASWLATLGGDAHLYGNASNAYKDLLVFLRGIRGSTRANVVIPNYMPAKLYRASLAAGCSVRFYEIDGSCAPDLEQMERLVDDDTVAILAIHYFGFPSKLDELAAIARRHGTTLIEDCALTLEGRHRGRRLGTIGDAAIFSMRKMFLYSEGGALRVGESLADFCPRYDHRVKSAWSAQHFLRQRGKRLYVRATGGADPLRLFRPDAMGYMDWSNPQALSVKQLSRFTELRMRWIDVDRAVGRRRAAYQYYAERFPRTPRFDPLHRALPDDVTPYSFPILVRDGTRDALRAELLRRGIMASGGWPESPFDRSHTRAVQVAASLLELPVHQALTDSQIERTIDAIRELAISGRASRVEAPVRRAA